MVHKLSYTASLNLSLGDHGSPRNQHLGLHDHKQLLEKKSTIKLDRWIPSLKLGLGRDQETNPADQINMIEQASNSMVSALSSFSNSTSAKDEKDDGSEEKASSKDDETVRDEGGACRKKLRLTKQQTFVLEKSFKQHNTLNLKQKQAVATSLDLRPRQVEVWFQNRRARTKLKQNEVECARLKKFCEALTSENRRLQKEIQELKAIRTTPQLYMQFRAANSHSMCPSCERIASGSGGGGGGGGRDMAKSSKIHITRAPKSHTHLFSQLC